ncbi:MAG: DUF721 domain-containing protein [Kofleriaceae bacterium]
MSRRRGPDDAVAAAEVIAQALAARGLTDELRAHDIVVSWPQIVGPRLSARAWPDGLIKRVLWIRVQSSAWLQELTLLRAPLAASIARHVGEPALFDEVRLHLGQRPRDDGDLLAGVRAPRPRPARAQPPPVAATGDHLAAIEAETSAIADPELREAVRRVRIRHDR